MSDVYELDNMDIENYKDVLIADRFIRSLIGDRSNFVKIFKDISDLRTSDYDFIDDDNVIVCDIMGAFKIQSTSNAMTIALNNSKYAMLLKDTDDFYDLSKLGLSNNTDLYPILQYMLTNDMCSIKLPKGTYSLSHTIELNMDNTPKIKIIGAGKDDTIINCQNGFINIAISSYNFVGSEIGCMTLSGIQTSVVGGLYDGIDLHSKNASPEDMADLMYVHDLRMKYFKHAMNCDVRMIWNKFENLTLQYNDRGFVYSRTSSDAYFNQNVFINCQFDTNKYAGIYIVGHKGHTVSNTFIGCSIEGNFYTDTVFGNACEAELQNGSFVFIGCHFEYGGSAPSQMCAVTLIDGSYTFDGCTFINYPNYLYVNVGATFVQNQPTYRNTSVLPYGTDSGTSVTNNAYTI